MDLVNRHGASVPFACLGAVLGLCWSGPFGAMSLVPLVSVAWALAPGRISVTALAGAYYGVALRPVVAGGAAYFGVFPWQAALLWLAWAGLLAAPWVLLWSPDVRGDLGARMLRLSGIWLLLALPGLGVLGVAHPMTGAGLWFPGWGVLGLLNCAALVFLADHNSTLGRATWGLATALSLLTMVAAERPEAPESWHAAQTSFRPFRLDDFGAQYDAAVEARGHVGSRAVTVLPEGAGGLWGRAAAEFWAERPHDSTVVLGAAEPHYSGLGQESYDNVAINLATGDAYRQRVPMPVSTWLPFSNKGARAHWSSAGVLRVDSALAGMLLCYETLLVWPAVRSGLEGAEVLVSMSNLGWFASDRRASSVVGASQRNALDAWGRLFGVPTVFSVNWGGAS